MSKLTLKAELDWIDNHPVYYCSDAHREDVKHNLCVLEQIKELEKATEGQVAELRATLRYGNVPKCVSVKIPQLRSV